ncbi:calcium-binding tyrosine phosphorylation-regulated protein isoform X1 [Erinaceus europaeus]|uniref:Calcium-binding tyrosine phosphorylation-regulated protein isoform X1 n=1 Tax=Erinaceus europaeus TaxID=9365 RepID=A0ABM3VZ66_ERIEU|nr:calcium-binding tyrosine phosphorylation-regulated protein isoform X1 [Erinaceus europaeus]XP_060029599.1 calcium-binding tyrosine phosphorylation-regulated protein isoform X1 [Erinaceus europaeus]XP_060029601.1 calcium-binding tyrosine phosphorylation-regulated protein isoform X1 [Erinaceus europaeus]
MISSKPRLVVPYGLKTLLEGVSRAVLKINPPNITQFAAIYFKELIMFREGNNCLDIKDLVKQFHQIKIEKWTEGTAQEKKPECVKGPEKIPVVPQEPERMEKSTDTEEDNIMAPLFSHKTTQFPSVYPANIEYEEPAEAVSGLKSATPKTASPSSSPPPAAVSPELAYVPADPAQFAAQMLGNVSSIHSNQSDVLMVDVATSMPAMSNEVLYSEAAEDGVVAPPALHAAEVASEQGLRQTSIHVDSGSKGFEAEPSTFPLQDEQEPPANAPVPEVPLQSDTQVTSAVSSVYTEEPVVGGAEYVEQVSEPVAVPRISSVYNDEPVVEGVTYVEQMPEQVAAPLTDYFARLKGNEQSPQVSPRPVVDQKASVLSQKSEGSAKGSQENVTYDSSVHVEAEATIILSGTSLKGQPEQILEVDSSAKTVSSEKSLQLEVEIIAQVPSKTGQESRASSATQEMEAYSVSSGLAAQAAPSGTSVKAARGSFPPVPEGLAEPEGEAAPDEV